MSRTERRVRERDAEELRCLASSLSDSEDVGVKGMLRFEAALCRDRSSELDIVVDDGVLWGLGCICRNHVAMYSTDKGFKFCRTVTPNYNAL